MELEEWTLLASAQLGLAEPVPAEALLDLARVTAHAVARPAAPISTFLVGLAAGRAGGSDADIVAAIDALSRLAQGVDEQPS